MLLFTLAAVSLIAASLPSDLVSLPADRSVRVIAQFTKPLNGAHRQLIKRHGGQVRRELPVVNAMAVEIQRGDLGRLALEPVVAQVVTDEAVQGAIDEAGPTIGAPLAFQSGWTGRGIGVAVIDSGVWTPHPDLQGRVVVNQDFRAERVNGDDLSGHGTHVAMIIAGNGTKSAGTNKNFRGVAPGATIVNLAALDRYNKGNESDVLAAIQRAIDLKSTHNIRVMNLSLGRPVSRSYKNDLLCQAVERAWNAGIVVVASAGNEGRNNTRRTNGYGTITSPGNDPWIITVGATNTRKTSGRGDDVVTSYSSKGPTMFDRIVKPDLVAPGNAIISALAQGGRYRNEYVGNVVPESYYKTNGNPNGDTYFTLSGTSMAAPMVSGTVALMLQRDPSLTPDQVKARLMRTASKGFPALSTVTAPDGSSYSIQHDLLTVGAGYLDIGAALADANKSSKRAPSPVLVYNSATQDVSLSTSVYGSNIVWGSASVWGNNVVWGTALLAGTNILWGDNVVWGDSTNQAFSVLWGDNILWGENTWTAAEADGVIIKGDNK